MRKVKSITLIALLSVLQNVTGNISVADSLQKLLPKLKDESRVITLNKLGKLLCVDSSVVALNFVTEAYELANKLKNDTLKADAAANIGKCNLYLENYSIAANYLNEALKSYSTYNKLHKVALMHYFNGLSNYYLGNYDVSLDLYLKSLMIYSKLDSLERIAKLYQNIGIIYHEFENYKKAETYYKKALILNNKLEKKDLIADVYQNIGLIKISEASFDSALYYLQKSLNTYKKLNNKEKIAISLSNIAIVYQKTNDYKKALSFFTEAHRYFNKLTKKEGCIYTLHNIGTIYENLNNSNKALEYYRQSLSKAREIGLTEMIISNYRTMSDAYKYIGNYVEAYDNYKRYKELEDSIKSSDTQARIAELEAQFKIDSTHLVAQQKIKLINQEFENKKKQQNRQEIIFISGILLLLIIVFIVYRAYYLKRKAEKELSEHKDNLEKLVKKRTVELKTETNERKIAEESDKLKSAFISNMSHELRTPMNAIISFSNFIKDPELSASKRNEYLNYITNAGESLLHLVDDIIDIAKIESGQLTITKSKCNITNLLNEANTIFTELIKRRNLDNISLHLEKECVENNVFIKTDSGRLKQVINNLLDNAIKYTKKGKIKFGYKNTEGFLHFYVKDTGIGIPKDKEKFIFERFSQLNKSDGKQLRGTGLGLAITKNLVKLLGGRIWLESEPDVGSTFYFSIPCLNFEIQAISAHPQKHLINAYSYNSYNWQGKSILIAEDEDLNFKVLESALLPTNAHIIRATSGEEAISCYKNSKVDLILMDIQMPNMDGHKATLEIKKIDNQIPIIAQTSFAMEGDKEKCLLSGCDDYLSKPLNLKDLMTKIDKYIQKFTS